MNRPRIERRIAVVASVAGLLHCLSIAAGIRADDWSDDVDAGPPPGPVAANNARYFDGLVFGKNSSAGVRRELNRFLGQKIAETDLICGLSDQQKQKLQLAGRGDLKRLFDRIDEGRRKLLNADESEADAILQALREGAAVLSKAVHSDPFEQGSLLSKTWARTLTPEQAARRAAFATTDRITGVRFEQVSKEQDDIREVRFPATPFGDADLERLGRIATLRKVVLDSTRITDAGLIHLAGLTNLEELDLADTRIDGSGLAHLEGFGSLRLLDLRRTALNGDNLVHLREMTGLKRLCLQETPVTDAGLAHLAGLTGLLELHLRGTPITDAGLASLKGLVNLRQLDLDGTQITDAGLESVAGLKKLHVLDLRGTRVTDAGLPLLAALPNLGHVYLFDTRVTNAGIAALKEALPKARLLR
jgi:uncharacterized protein YjbI with pentapeptide repeats